MPFDSFQAVGELRDFAFENKIVYFNGADRAGVEDLAAETGSLAALDLAEPKNSLKDARAAVQRTRELLPL